MKRPRCSRVFRFLLAFGFLAVPAEAQTVVTVGSGYNGPQFVAVDRNSTVFVTDPGAAQNDALTGVPLVNGVYATTPVALAVANGALGTPEGIAVDQGGNIFIADNNPQAGAVVKEILAPGYVTVRTLYTAGLNSLFYGIALDGNGNVFVVDYRHSAVIELPAPNYTTPRTIYTTSSADTLAGLAIDRNGNVFVTDSGNTGVIREIVAAGGYTTVNTLGAGNFAFPIGVAVDSGGNLYVADFDGRTVKELQAPGYTTVVTIDSSDFISPVGIALDDRGNIFVADSGLQAVKEILASSPTGPNACVAPALGGTVSNLGSGYIGPQFVAVDRNSTVFVTDPFAAQNDALTGVPLANGAYATTPVALAVANGALGGPEGIAVDQGGNIFIADNNPQAGAVVKEILAPGYVTVRTLYTAGLNSGFYGIALDGNGNVFVVDYHNSALIELPAPNYTTPRTIYTASSADTLAGLAIDSNGNVFVTDILSNNTGVIREIVAAGGYTTVNTLGAGNFTFPIGVAVDCSGNLYVADLDEHAVKELLAPGYTTVGTIDSSDFTSPVGIAFDGRGNLFVTDDVLHAVKEILALPAVTGLNPSTGPTSGSNTVTIAGGNLTGSNGVFFGGTPATGFSVIGDAAIAATAPASAAGTVDVTVTGPGGASSISLGDRYTFAALPVVSSVSPTDGPTAGGTPVTITGSNFTGASAVTFGIHNATGYSVLSASQIVATAPAGSGAVDITVTTAGGTSATSAAAQFTYFAAPTVTAVSPASGPAGATLVTITGTNFSGTSAVAFGTRNATSYSVISATRIIATAPAGSAGTVDITVTTPGGTSATGAADQFTYVAAPAVTAVSPAAGPTAGGTSVTITGTSFTGASAVKFGTINSAGYTVVSATQIVATVPAGSAGTVDITVTTLLGVSATSAADQFTYVNAPSVTAISPAAGTTAGGTSVTITGTNFIVASAVTFGTRNATSYSVISATQITASAPAGATGTVDITVTTPGGTSATGVVDRFTYVAAPTVTAVGPTTGPAAGGTLVTITGTSFIGATAVKFGTNNAASYSVISATQITASAPPGSAGTVDITVTTPGGTSATGVVDRFTYVAAPTVTAVSPAAGPITGGTLVSITGTSLTGAIAVKFGTNNASSYSVISATQITATTPAGSAGTVDITVITPAGVNATSAADQFTYAAAPTVTAISPTSGPAAGGTPVTVTGTNFTGAIAVNFGTNNATSYSVISATQIASSAPAGSAGTVDITVTTPGGTSAISAADRFAYVAAPAVTAVSPTTGPTAGGTSVTIAGTNFTGASTVKFGANNASGYSVISATQIAATAPAGSAGTVDITVTTAGGISAISAADRFSYGAGPNVYSPCDINQDGKINVIDAQWTVNEVLGVDSPSNDLNGDGAVNVVDLQIVLNAALTQVCSENAGPPAMPTIAAVVNAASLRSGPIAPGEVVALIGSGFAGGVKVLFDGRPAPLTYVSPTQITCAVPYEVSGKEVSEIQVRYRGSASAPFSTGTAVTNPAIFTADGSGNGPIAALNEDRSGNSPANPAFRGSTVVLFVTGEGQTSPPGITGGITALSGRTPQPELPVAVLIGGQPASVEFYGEAPGVISGVMQLKVRIPTNVLSGNLPVSVTIGGNSSQDGVTVSVRE